MSEQQTPPGGSTEERALDAGALKALGHPVRVRIFDILTQFGPQTASSLADRLGESTGSTSYHLRALARHNLVREVPDRGTARERWWERPEGGVMIGTPEVTRTPAGRAATQLVSAELYRLWHEQLMRFLDSPESAERGDEIARLQAGSISLTPEQFAEVSGELVDVIDRAVARYRKQEGEGVESYLLRLDFFPLGAENPARRTTRKDND